MFERIRRGVAHFHRDSMAYPPGVTSRYDPARPWEIVFALSVHPGFPEATAFWHAEVHQQVGRFSRRGPQYALTGNRTEDGRAQHQRRRNAKRKRRGPHRGTQQQTAPQGAAPSQQSRAGAHSQAPGYNPSGGHQVRASGHNPPLGVSRGVEPHAGGVAPPGGGLRPAGAVGKAGPPTND